VRVIPSGELKAAPLDSGCRLGRLAIADHLTRGTALARMASFKVPRSVVFLDALPLNATGKVMKDQLR
jgi:HIP---CoA ligase